MYVYYQKWGGGLEINCWDDFIGFPILIPSECRWMVPGTVSVDD